MQRVIGSIAIFAGLPFALSAQDAETRPDFAAFSKLIHKTVVKELPKEFTDDTGWGQTIPVPPKLPLPNLRTYLKKGNEVVLPHGAWQRFKGKVEEPDKNLKIAVKEFQKTADGKKYRLAAEVDVAIVCHGEWQLWQKGLLLVGAESSADASFKAEVFCEVGVTLNIKKFPPELGIEPKITDLKLNLVDFNFRHEPIIKGEAGDQIRRDLKELLRSLVKQSEGAVKDYANEAIEKSLKEGKGRISAGTIMETLPPPKK